MDLKELEKFFKLCRKQGVTQIDYGGIAVKFGDMPAKLQAAEDEIETPDEPTTDELIFWATQNTGPA